MQEQYMSVEEARTLLGVSKTKIASMIERGELIAVVDPLNRRRKRVKAADVEAILQKRKGMYQ